jgi:hydrogenase maturation protease
MTQTAPVRCLVLACGNPLRSDDGVGPRLAEWAAERFQHETGVRVMARSQWTPELTADLAAAESVLFVDSSLETAPGRVSLIPVRTVENGAESGSHHLEPTQLLGMTRALYGSIAVHALLLTIGAGSVELGEVLSDPVKAAFPRACGVLEKTVRSFMAE